MPTWPPVTPAAASTSSRAASISGATASPSLIPSRAPSAASASVAAWNRLMTAVTSCIDMGPLLVRRISALGWRLGQALADELCVPAGGAGGCRRAADDERAHERRGLGHGEVLDVGDGESRLLDGGERRPVAVAAHDGLAHPVHAVLVAGKPGITGADMLDEQQLPAGPQHPAKLAQRPRLVADPA